MNRDIWLIIAIYSPEPWNIGNVCVEGHLAIWNFVYRYLAKCSQTRRRKYISAGIPYVYYCRLFSMKHVETQRQISLARQQFFAAIRDCRPAKIRFSRNLRFEVMPANASGIPVKIRTKSGSLPIGLLRGTGHIIAEARRRKSRKCIECLLLVNKDKVNERYYRIYGHD